MSRIAVVQMTSRADWPGNQAIARRLLAEAADAGAALVVLPENLAIMGHREADKLALAEPPGHGPIQDFLAEQAARHGLWIVGGTIPERTGDGERVLAACPVYDAQGRERARYHKIHLFDVFLRGGEEVYRESATVQPGRQVVTLDTPVGRLGLAVCYDIRFPELFRLLAEQGAEVVALPAAFTVPTGMAHWDVLLRARAIENLFYVAAAAQAGEHENGRKTWGHSLVAGPWGNVLAERAEGEGIVVADIELEEIRRRRASIPCLEHRRFHCDWTN